MSDPGSFIRLSKLMSERGLCSRREADELISRGLVKVDGHVVKELGTRVSPEARIDLTSEAKVKLAAKATVVLNKPKGYVSSQPEDGYKAAVELVTRHNQDAKDPRRFSPATVRGLAPAGRLDIDSQGLLVLTQDGVVAKKLIGADSTIEKEYLVRVRGSLSAPDLARLGAGTLVIEGRRLKPALVEWVNEDQLRFVLTEGMKRQVRKMCSAVGLSVLGLKRVRIGKIRLGNLREGQWRYLRSDESFD